jgi:hypothetical protein
MIRLSLLYWQNIELLTGETPTPVKHERSQQARCPEIHRDEFELHNVR